MLATILGYAIAATFVSLIPSAAIATPIDLSEEKPGSLSRNVPWAIVLDFDLCDLDDRCPGRARHWHEFGNPADWSCDPAQDNWPSLRHRPLKAHRHDVANTADCRPENSSGTENDVTLFGGSLAADHSTILLEGTDLITTLPGGDTTGATEIVAGSNFILKVDSAAGGDPPAPIPEPSTALLLLVFALCSTGLKSRGLAPARARG